MNFSSKCSATCRALLLSRSARATVIVAFLFAAGLFGGAWAGSAAANRMKEPYADLELFARVLSIIEQDYVDEKDSSHLVRTAIQGMVDELDPHSTWLSPEEYRNLISDTQGQYEGIGVEVRPVDAGILVSKVLENSPAAAAGLRPQDIIVAINKKSIVGQSIDEVSRQLKGPRGTEVSLTINRKGTLEPVELTAIRDRVEMPAVSTAKFPGGIAYVRLIQFQRGCAEELEQAVLQLRDAGHSKGLVLDLRNNPGGLLEESIAVSDLFLKDGVIVSTRSRIEGETKYEAQATGLPDGIPLAILVNGMSASASEIVAGALQDRKRAILVGAPTYGKGSVQTLYENTDASALKLTIGRYYAPSGAPVAPREGRNPDELIYMGSQTSAKDQLANSISGLGDVSKERRSEMLKLLNTLKDAPEVTKIPWNGPVEERLAKDPQLRRAVQLLENR